MYHNHTFGGVTEIKTHVGHMYFMGSVKKTMVEKYQLGILNHDDLPSKCLFKGSIPQCQDLFKFSTFTLD